MKLYITKYALTHGAIMEVDGKVCSETMASWGSWDGSRQFAHGNDWHYTKVEAMDRADDMRRDKIKSLQDHIESLQNHIVKLAKLDFSGE